MAFKKGESGNPNGRPKGGRNAASVKADEIFEELLFGTNEAAKAIITKTVEMAKAGDTACMKLCYERIAPPRKDRPIFFELPKMKEAKDAVEATVVIAEGISSGEITPSEAAELSKVVESFARTLQAADLAERVAKLEQERGAR